LMLVIFLIFLFSFFIYTHAGLKTLIHQSNRYNSDYVTIENAEGRLGKRFTLKNVELTLPNYQPLEIPSLALKWDYWQLLNKRIDVESLSIAGANLDFTPIVKQEEVADKEESAPFSLKDLDIP